MALIFMDGFDKYGGVNSNLTSVAALMVGEWTSLPGLFTIVAPLSATGQALQQATAGTNSKTLAANYGRIIGGIRFSSNLGNQGGVQFTDAGTAQCGIQIPTTGTITFRNGAVLSGTIIGTGATPVSANTTHYLEWDITLGNAAAYNIYLDGVSIISGTGDTTATANNTINGFALTQSASAIITWDDLYLFDATGTTNNAVLLTSPRIETQLPNADNAVQFSIGASVLGGTVSRNSSNASTSANWLYLRPLTPSRSCTLNSISIMPVQTLSTANLRPVIYADNAGSPTGGALLSTGSTVVGQTAGTPVTMPLTTPQSLTAGTQYWLGWMVDTAPSNVAGADTNNTGRTVTATFSSGAPATGPAMTTGAITPLVWGNITLAAPVNYYEVNQQPPPGTASYVYSSTPAQEDLYNFPNLSTPGAVIHSVAVKGFAQKSDAGTRTMSLRTKSGLTDSGGSLTGQALGTSMQWYGSFFPTDPNTSAAWTVTNLNNALGGMRLDS